MCKNDVIPPLPNYQIKTILTEQSSLLTNQSLKLELWEANSINNDTQEQKGHWSKHLGAQTNSVHNNRVFKQTVSHVKKF